MKKLVYFLLCMNSLFSFSQTNEGKKEIISFQSEVYKKERKIAVYIPSNFENLKEEKCQVVYLLDGQWDELFNYVSGSINFLLGSGEMNNTILVGIYSENRAKEFVPKPVTNVENEKWKKKQTFGFSELFDKHLVGEVFPLIEKKFNVNNYKLAIGHSLGGTYLINSFASNHKIFNSYIAISPNLEFDQDQIQKRAKKLIDEQKIINSFLAVSIGDADDTEKEFLRGIQALNTVLKDSQVQGLHYRLDYVKDATHITSLFKQIPLALLEHSKIFKNPSKAELEKMLNNNQISFCQQIKNYFSKLYNWAGYINHNPSENCLNDIAYQCLKNKKPNEGLTVLDCALQMYPGGINLYDSKAEMLENLNQKKEAANVLKIGLNKLEENKTKLNEDYTYYKEILEKHLAKLE